MVTTLILPVVTIITNPWLLVVKLYYLDSIAGGVERTTTQGLIECLIHKYEIPQSKPSNIPLHSKEGVGVARDHGIQ